MANYSLHVIRTLSGIGWRKKVGPVGGLPENEEKKDNIIFLSSYIVARYHINYMTSSHPVSKSH